MSDSSYNSDDDNIQVPTDDDNDNNIDDSNDNENNDNESKEDILDSDQVMDGSFMGNTKVLSALYRQLIEVQNKYNCSVNMPQFAFVGVQSSGKSSALSQMLNMPSGVVQDGTGTRCPVRFTLKQDISVNQRKITVDGRDVTNYIEMTKAIVKYTTGLKNTFDDTILEVEISGPNIPNFVIVDLPGIIKKNLNEGKILSKMTSRFLCEKLPNNAGFAYIPVFIRQATDYENDNDPDQIDKLCKHVRPNWKREAIIVINKIDLKWSRNSSDLLGYMQKLTRDNPESTVICMCNPSAKRIDANEDKVKEVEEYIRNIPRIEKEKWDQKIKDVGNSPQLRKFVEKYCYVTRLRDIMRNRSIEIVKESIGPVKAKLDRVEKRYETNIQNMELQLHNCKAENIRNEKARYDDTFLKIHLAFYKGEMGHQVSTYGLTWEQEMKRFFKSESKVADSDWVKNYYLSPSELLQAFKDRRQPKETIDTSSRLQRNMEARLMGTAAIWRALELWRAMISFMSLSKYTIEQVLNSHHFFGHNLYPTVEDTVQKLLLKASENLKNGCVWLGQYICWKLQEDAKKLHENLIKQKIQLKYVDPQMEKIYRYTFREYVKYVQSIVKQFITTAKVEPRDLCAIFDSLATHHYVNLGRLVSKDFKKLGELNQLGSKHKTEDRKKIFEDEINEMRRQQSNIPIESNQIENEPNNSNNNNNNNNNEEIQDNDDDEDSSSGEQPIIDNDNEDDGDNEEVKVNDTLEITDEQVDMVGQYQNEFESSQSHNKHKDIKFFFNVYGMPTKMFNNRNDVHFIRFYAAVHWKYIKFHVIKTIQEKFNHRVMFHIKQRSTDLARALREGVEKPKLDSLVKELALKAKIAIDVLDKAVDDLIKNGTESSKLVATSFKSLTDDELENTYGVNTDLLRKKIAKHKTDLHNFRKSKEEINSNLYKIENSANFDSEDVQEVD